LAPGRPAAATDTLPRAVPLGEDTTWPLQPEPAPKPEGAPRAEPSLRAEPPRSQRPPTSVEESIQWPGEAETPAAPLPAPSPPRDRKPFAVDPLAGLAEELSRIPPAPAPGGLEPRPAPRRAPRPSLPASPAAPTADAPLTPASDQNLSEMAQRLEAALRRPKSAEKSGGKPGDSAQPGPRPEPAGPALEDFAPPPASRLGAALRRPFSTDDVRASPFAPKTAGEAAAADMDEFAPAPSGPRFDTIPRRPLQADEARPTPAPAANEMPEAAPPEHTPDSADVADGKPTPPKSLYDSLEQEMASLLNRPPSKP
jgi:hypothetical protein